MNILGFYTRLFFIKKIRESKPGCYTVYQVFVWLVIIAIAFFVLAVIISGRR